MSLSQQLEQQIRATIGGPVDLAARDGEDHLVCELTELGSLGVSVQRLELRTPKLANLSSDSLRKVADDLAGRVSYLLEAITPIEVDEEQCTVQMRSTPPYRAENATSYYEILVAAGAIGLMRYKKGRSEARHAEPFAITREVLYRLVNDFVGAAKSAMAQD